MGCVEETDTVLLGYSIFNLEGMKCSKGGTLEGLIMETTAATDYYNDNGSCVHVSGDIVAKQLY